jgi:hypothetical protein
LAAGDVDVAVVTAVEVVDVAVVVSEQKEIELYNFSS